MEFRQQIIVGIGELLWDYLPSGAQLGGAPTNFACMTTQLGDRGIVASRVGADDAGREALRQLNNRDLNLSQMQLDETHPTGTVQVQVDDEGQPEFTITEDVAWDYLAWTPRWEELAVEADAVCFGTLAQRAPVARQTIQNFLQATRRNALLIFDVNLRQAFHSVEVLVESLKLAQIVKLNHDELPRVAAMLELGGRSEQAFAHRLIQVFGLELVCVTRGARGSLLVTETDIAEHPGFQVMVADTIGAGVLSRRRSSISIFAARHSKRLTRPRIDWEHGSPHRTARCPRFRRMS